MRKIIAIGESVLDTIYENGQPTQAFVGGRIANAAASLGLLGLPVSMVSECCTDIVGDTIINFFKHHNVDVKSVDRFTDGATAFSAIFMDQDGKHIVNYGKYPDDRFDVVWPRIDENDIVIFGSLYAIDLPQRERLFEMITYAAERKAIIIYLPGFQHGINFRITKVMPAILENLEIADIVLAALGMYEVCPGSDMWVFNTDLSLSLFGRNRRLNLPAGANGVTNLLGWQAGFTAGIVYHIVKNDLTRDALHQADDEAMNRLVADALTFARCCASTMHNCITTDFARQHRDILDKAQRERELKAQ